MVRFSFLHSNGFLQTFDFLIRYCMITTLTPFHLDACSLDGPECSCTGKATGKVCIKDLKALFIDIGLSLLFRLDAASIAFDCARSMAETLNDQRSCATFMTDSPRAISWIMGDHSQVCNGEAYLWRTMVIRGGKGWLGEAQRSAIGLPMFRGVFGSRFYVHSVCSFETVFLQSQMHFEKQLTRRTKRLE